MPYTATISFSHSRNSHNADAYSGTIEHAIESSEFPVTNTLASRGVVENSRETLRGTFTTLRDAIAATQAFVKPASHCIGLELGYNPFPVVSVFSMDRQKRMKVLARHSRNGTWIADDDMLADAEKVLRS